MTKEEADLIIAEQNKSTEEILKAVAKVKADYHELCKLKDMRIAELEAENAELKEKYAKNITDCDICDTYCNSQLTKAKELLKRYVPYRQITDSKAYKDLAEETEQFLNSEVEK